MGDLENTAKYMEKEAEALNAPKEVCCSSAGRLLPAASAPCFCFFFFFFFFLSFFFFSLFRLSASSFCSFCRPAAWRVTDKTLATRAFNRFSLIPRPLTQTDFADMGSVYEQLKQDDKALELYKRHIRHHPNDAMVMESIADILLRKKRPCVINWLALFLL